MPDFKDAAPYVWAITIIGLVFPLLLTGYALARVRWSKQRLERLQQDADET